MDGVHSKRRSGCYIPKLHRFLHSPNRDDGGSGGDARDARDDDRHAHRGGVHAHHGRDDVHVHPPHHRDLLSLQSMKQK